MFLGVQPLLHLQTLLQVSALHELLSVNAYKPVRQSGSGSCRTCTSVFVWSGYMQLGATKRAPRKKPRLITYKRSLFGFVWRIVGGMMAAGFRAGTDTQCIGAPDTSQNM